MAFVASLALLLPVAAASAATVTFRDLHGGYYPGFDITRVTMRNDRYISAKVHVRGLYRRVEVFGINFWPIAHYDVVNYQALTVLRANGNVTGSLHRYTAEGDDKLRCPVRGQWRIQKQFVKIRLPQDCLAESHTLRMEALIGPGNGAGGDPWDWTKVTTVRLN
jgi:hypothetical protein